MDVTFNFNDKSKGLSEHRECKTCLESKSITCFTPNNRIKSGYYFVCTACSNTRKRTKKQNDNHINHLVKCGL